MATPRRCTASGCCVGVSRGSRPTRATWRPGAGARDPRIGGVSVIQFDAAPPVPLDYPLLRALTPEEIGLARAAGYVGEKVDPCEPVRRAGLNNYDAAPAEDDLRDWRTRM